MESRANNRKAPAAELPQWNSRFRFSAQKGGQPAAENKENAAKSRNHRTPHLSSGPRRIPVGKVAGEHAAGSKGESEATPGAGTPLDSNKTPTVCLFQKFESLSLTTPTDAVTASSQRDNTASRQPHLQAMASPLKAQEEALGGEKQRRSVAFGTPSVLTYTPAEPASAAVVHNGTPLWSNAGHTPYSMAGNASGGRLLSVYDTHSNISVIGSSSEVRMELFSTLVTDTDMQQTPAATMAAPLTPADRSGQPTLACTDVASYYADADTGQVGSPESQDMLLTPVAGNRSAALHSKSSSFTGFGAGVLASADAKEEGTPPFFSKAHSKGSVGACSTMCAAHEGAMAESGQHNPQAQAAAGGNVAMAAASSGVVQHQCSSDRSEQRTPNSRLRQPSRVPIEGASRPTIPLELKQLLSDPQSAAAVDPGATVGTVEVLSPVRPRKQTQHALGAADQILSPVRRSARKAAKHLSLPTDTVAVTPMLEATNYCYRGRGSSQAVAL